VTVQPNGVEKLLPLGKLSSHEQNLLKDCLGELGGSITSKLTMFISLHQALALRTDDDFASCF